MRTCDNHVKLSFFFFLLKKTKPALLVKSTFSVKFSNGEKLVMHFFQTNLPWEEMHDGGECWWRLRSSVLQLYHTCLSEVLNVVGSAECQSSGEVCAFPSYHNLCSTGCCWSVCMHLCSMPSPQLKLLANKLPYLVMTFMCLLTTRLNPLWRTPRCS